MATSIYCLATSESQAHTIVDRLRDAAFNADAISVLFPDRGTTRYFAQEKETKAPEVAAVGAGTGLVVGVGLGWLIGISSLAIPGVGPFIAAGSISAAISGGVIGGTVGGLSGALIGMGISEHEAKDYEGKLHDGRVLISVHSATGEETATIRRIFTDEGAEDIAAAGEADVPAHVQAKQA